MARSRAAQSLAGILGVAGAAWLISFTAQYEGERLYGYRDPVGIATKCYGDTENVVIGARYTREECAQSLDRRLAEKARAVLVCTPQLRTRPYQLWPAIDFSYNVGEGAYCRSTMAKYYRAGQWRRGCDEYLKWMQKNQGLGGIARRRVAARQKCLEGL